MKPAAKNQTIGDLGYYERTLGMLETSYLEADARGDLAGGSGSGGGLQRWELKRRVLARAFDHDGTWLDVGCANGLLMETLTRWTGEAGLRIEPYGLDLSVRIAEAARGRLWHWADRIWAGNVMTWEPPLRFDYATVIADAVPRSARADLIERLIAKFLKPSGRLIFSIYIPRPPEAPAELPPASTVLKHFGYCVAGEAEARIDGELKVSVAWLDVERQPDSVPEGGFAPLVPELHVNDLEKSLEFWRDLCGFQIAYERREERFVYLQSQGVQIMLCQRHGRYETGNMQSPLGQGAMFQIYLQSIEPVLSALREAQWPLYEEPRDAWYRAGDRYNGLRQFLVQDPDGYLILFAHSLGARINHETK
jgi:catechol 2,3-dioxygenase-like lactoylglutathione lyase family enzyme